MPGSVNRFGRFGLITVFVASLSFVPGLAQKIQEERSFEVASIRPAARDTSDSRVQSDPTFIRLRSVTLQRILLVAYALKPYQLDGPKWIESERFDVLAGLPGDQKREQMPSMLRELVVDRFGMQSHFERRALPVFDLVNNGKKLKLRPPDLKSVSASGYMAGRLDLYRLTMPQLAEQLTPLVGRPVFDTTGLTGSYSGLLTWSDSVGPLAGEGSTPDNTPDRDIDMHPTTGGPSISTALIEQLGLKLLAKKAPVDVLVIDHINRQPTEN